MKGLRKILWVSWTAKKTNERVFNKDGSKEGTVRHCQCKEVSILWSHHEETGDCREKDIMQGTMPGEHR